MATSQPEAPARKLRWFQYSLRSLLLLVLLVSLGMSWVAVRMKRAREQEQAVEEIAKVGGEVQYDYQDPQFRTSGDPFAESDPPGPAWLRNVLGQNFFAAVVAVDFRRSSVNDAGLGHVERLMQLQTLDLSGAQITDAGLQHLKGLTQLKTLFLSGRKVTDAGLEHLRGLTQLQQLNLYDTQVTDAGLSHLKGLTQLQTLFLGGTKVTDEGVKRLEQALPNCFISRQN
jgi:hypothetical protein